MTISIGPKVIMGAIQEAAYRTPLDVIEKILLTSESINMDPEQDMHEYLQGSAGIPGIQNAFDPVVGGLQCDIPYTILNAGEFVGGSLLIALAMGANAYVGGQGSNEITLADDLGVFGTLAWDKNTAPSGDVWEVASAYFNSMTLGSETNSHMKASFDIQGYDLFWPGRAGATQNQVSDLTSLPTDLATLIMHNDFILRMNIQDGALADADRLGISKWSIVLNNNLTSPEQSTIDNTTTHTDPLKTIQPVRNGFREVTFEITIPRYGQNIADSSDHDAFSEWRTNETKLQADLFATGPSGEEFDIFLPHLRVVTVGNPVPGPGVVTTTVGFKALLRNSLSDIAFGQGTNDDGELWIETDDGRSGAILA